MVHFAAGIDVCLRILLPLCHLIEDLTSIVMRDENVGSLPTWVSNSTTTTTRHQSRVGWVLLPPTSNAAKFGAEAPATCNDGEVGMTPDASTKSKGTALTSASQFLSSAPLNCQPNICCLISCHATCQASWCLGRCSVSQS